MSEPRGTRRSLTDDEDDEDDERFPVEEDRMSNARRFLWDEDEEDDMNEPEGSTPKIGAGGNQNMNVEGFGQDVDLEDNLHLNQGSMAVRKKRNTMSAADDDMQYSDDSVSRGSHEYGKIKRRGPIATAFMNFVHTFLGLCGLCWDALFGRNNPKRMRNCLLFLGLLGFIIGVSVVMQNDNSDGDAMSPMVAPVAIVTPTQPEPAPADQQISEANRLQDIKTILSSNAAIQSKFLSQDGAPQKKALDWLAQQDSFRGEDSITERYAMVAFFFSTDGALNPNTGSPSTNWATSENWLTGTSICSWYGIECVDNQAISFNLTSNHVRGSIPADIGALTALITLDLSMNKLISTLPIELSSLTNLHSLNLLKNRFRATLPDLTILTSLREINVGMNMFSAFEMPDFSSLTDLKALGLQENKFAGSLEELAFPSDLEIIFLDNNKFTGSIPDSVYSLTSLTTLRLDNNELTGTLSDQLGSMSNLVVLKCSDNQFQGTFPDVFSNWGNLVELFLIKNLFTGTIHDSIGSLSNLQQLYLGYNEFSGGLPNSMQQMTALHEIYVVHNNLSSSVPEIFDEMQELKVVKFQHNQLDGQIPSSLGACPILYEIVLDHNQFSGQVPTELGDLVSLEKMTLNGNSLTGPVPLELCALTVGGLLELLLIDCPSEGGIQCSCCTCG